MGRVEWRCGLRRAFWALSPNDGKKLDLGATDIWFTTKSDMLYTFVRGWPQGELKIESLELGAPQQLLKVIDVRQLGRDEPLKFIQDNGGLWVSFPARGLRLLILV